MPPVINLKKATSDPLDPGFSRGSRHSDTGRFLFEELPEGRYQVSVDGRGPVDPRGDPRLRRLLHRARRGPSGRADRRPRVGDRQRRDRRAAAGRHGHARPLPDHRHRRPRHDVELDQRRPARPHGAPATSSSCCRTGPSWIDHAADELIRYSSPVKHFLRTCREPFSRCGTWTFQPGERLYLSYASANRDDEVFPDPFRLDVRRENTASPPRLRLRPALLPRRPPGPHGDPGDLPRAARAHRVASSSAGEPTWIRANFVQGPKSIPLEYSFR